MKNLKHTSVILATLITLFTFMTLISGLFGDGILFYTFDGQYTIDWHYTGIYCGFLLVSLICIIIRICKVTTPLLREQKPYAKASLVLDIFALIGIVIIVASAGALDHAAIDYSVMDSARVIAGSVFLMIGFPLHFICPLLAGKLSKKAMKEFK